MEIHRIEPGPSGTLGEYAHTTEVTGPGVFRCWFREGMATVRSISDDTGITTVYANPDVWKEFATLWTEVRFTVAGFADPDGVVIRGRSLGPCLLLDQLRIDPPPPTPYEKWAETTGLLGHPLGSSDQDADGDGMVNLVEFAFGLPPRAAFYYGVVHPLAVSLIPHPGQADSLLVEFRAVPGVVYTIETQLRQNPNAWSPAGTITTTTTGSRTWESPPGMTDSGHLLVRVRVSLP